jgi:hypothetical protein
MKKKKQIKELKKQLQWHYKYMFYVANFYNIVDAEACGYADGDNEYLETLNNKIVFNNIMQSINCLNEYQKKQLAIILISQTLTSASFMDAINLSGIDLFDSIGNK